jgi:hypothetical protein
MEPRNHEKEKSKEEICYFIFGGFKMVFERSNRIYGIKILEASIYFT